MISVAAVSNSHVYAPPLHVLGPDAPESLRSIPMAAAFEAPAAAQRTLVDVTTITGTNGRPVESRLCGLGVDPNDPTSNPLPADRSPAPSCSHRAALHVPLEGARAQAAAARSG